MKKPWFAAMLSFVAVFYGFMLVSGLLSAREDAPLAADEKQRLVEMIQQKEDAARQNLMKDPALLNALSGAFLLAMATGMVLGVRALLRRRRDGRWPVETLPELSAGWGAGEVFQALIFLLFIEACFFLLQSAGQHLLHLRMDIPDSLLILSSLLRDFLVLAFVWMTVRAGHGQGLKELGLRFERFFGHARAGLTAYLATLPVLLVVFTVTAWVMQVFSLQPEPQSVVQMYLKPSTEPFLLPLTFFVALLGPLMEEVLFRGFAFAGLKRRFGVWGGACISSAGFAALHMNWAVFVPVFVLGMILAHLYEHSGSLVPPITLHILHNVVMVALTLGFKELSS